MNEIQKQLDKAFTLISAIPVSGDAVDIMAMAIFGTCVAFLIKGLAKNEGAA